MLPEEKFRPQMACLDLPALKEAFPYASWEVIARRWAQLRPAALTIFDAERLTCRVVPPTLKAPPRPTEPELELIAATYRAKSHLASSLEPLVMQSYFIDDGRGIERVILLTEVENFEF